MATPSRESPLRAAWTPPTIVAALALTAAGAGVLARMGRSLWCPTGDLAPWSWDIRSAHNSQHLLDPYTLTHILHGLLYYAVLWLVCRGRWPAARALLAVSLEVGWEIAENTNAVIATYRESTLALNYHGDSIANSLSDVAACALGYTLALRLPVWVAAAGFAAVEAALLLAIRDSLLLNVLMLLHPIAALKAWQTGG